MRNWIGWKKKISEEKKNSDKENATQKSRKSITEHFEEKKRKKLEKAKKLKSKWELMRICLEFIEQNEDWLIASRMERQYDEEKRKELWEKELRFKKIEEKKNKNLGKIKTKEETEKLNLVKKKIKLFGKISVQKPLPSTPVQATQPKMQTLQPKS